MKKIIALILAIAIVFSASSLSFAKEYNYIYASDEVYPESAHDYPDDTFCTWEYTLTSGAQGLFITFSQETLLSDEYNYVESEYGTYSSYDNIYISYPKGDSWEYISTDFRGNQLSGKTFYIPSNRFRITLSADAEDSAFGFSFDEISTEPPEDKTIIRYHYTSTDKIDNYTIANDEAEIEDIDGLRNGNLIFAGWSTEPDGESEYVAGQMLENGKTHDLYAVWSEPIIAFEDSFSFRNSDVGNVYPAEDDYYMTDSHYKMMIGNLFKNFGIGPIPAPIVAVVLATYPSWEHKGSCYGIATSVFLQYYGEIDFLEGTGASKMNEVELDGEIISRINYYQALCASSYLCENLAPLPGTPVYAEQMKNMFETVESGKPVLFSYYSSGSPYLVSAGHTVVFTGAFTDNNGNHYLVACDSNYGYSEGECHYYRLSSDFTEIYDCRRAPDSFDDSKIGGFNWTADYKHFGSFDIGGNGSPDAWYTVFLGHIVNWVKTVFSALFIN